MILFFDHYCIYLFFSCTLCFDLIFLFRLRFTAGVIPRNNFDGFERLLWRACRGNVFLRSAEIETPIEEPPVEKVFT